MDKNAKSQTVQLLEENDYGLGKEFLERNSKNMTTSHTQKLMY